MRAKIRPGSRLRLSQAHFIQIRRDHLLPGSPYLGGVSANRGAGEPCPEEVAHRIGFMDRERLLDHARILRKGGDRAYFEHLAADDLS